MAQRVFFEVYDTEEELQNFINDPISDGMTPFTIYRWPANNKAGYEVFVWWKAEDANED